MKKLICMLLVLVLCLGLGTSALADGGAELPDVADYLASYLADYDPAAEIVMQDPKDENTAVALTIENVSDMDGMLEQTRFALDVMFLFFGFESMTELEEEPDQTEWETTYSYPDGGVGTVTSFVSGTECSAYFVVEDVVNFVFVVVGYGDGVAIKSLAAGTDTADTSVSGDGILPDAWAFFHGEATHEDETITNGMKAVFSFEQEYAAAAYEYADLLQSSRFGLTLTQNWTSEYSNGDVTTFYLFDSAVVGEDEQVDRYADGMDRYGDVILQINDWPSFGWCEMSIRFSDVLTVVDTGDRSTVTGLVDSTSGGFSGPMGGSSGPSSGGGYFDDDDDDYSPYKPETKCYKCHGSGEITCSQCGGTGYETRYVSSPNYSGSSTTSDTSRVTCGKCHGSGDVTCPACGGSGKG